MALKYITIELKGSSACRRKQFRAILRKYPDKRISRSAPTYVMYLGDKRIECDEANTPQTHVIVYLEEDTITQPTKEPDHYETQVVKDKSCYRPQV